MTREQFTIVQQAAAQCGLKVEAVETGIQRVSAQISGRLYANQQQALSKLASQFKSRKRK